MDSIILALNIIQYKTYSVSKATEQISRSTETEDLINGLLFNRTNNKQVDSDDKLTLDFIEVKIPALLELGDHAAEEP